MAYMGRGEKPSLDNSQNTKVHRFYYGQYYTFHYIPLNNTYVIMQMIVTFIILIVGVIAYCVMDQSAIVDPIGDIKKNFINAQFITITLLLIAIFITNFFSKSEITLLKRLMIILAVSVVMMAVFLGIKLNFDLTYTTDQFEEIYEALNGKEQSDTKTKIDINFTEVSLKTDKQFYVDEAVKLYDIFKIKTYGILVIYLLLNGLLVYQMINLFKMLDKKDRLDKDDLILFDQEDVFKN